MEWWVTPGPGGVVGHPWTWWSGGPHLDLVEWWATPGPGGVVGHTWTWWSGGSHLDLFGVRVPEYLLLLLCVY